MKGRKLPRFLTPNFIGACEEFMRQTGKQGVKLGEFLTWLARNRKSRMKNKFVHGDRIKLVGENNPFAGETGYFVEYQSKYVEEKRIIVILDSDKSEHYFYEDEVKGIKND